MKALNYIDISPLLSPDIAVFPGDKAFQRTLSMSCEEGDHLTLSSIETTLHAGAHADGPNHYVKNGVGIEQRSLNFYMGLCQVFHPVGLTPGERIGWKHLPSATAEAPRVLFRTDSYLDPNEWSESFNSFEPELIEGLASQGVILIGIDTPSIDPAQSKQLESHQMVARKDLAILEGLVLSGVQEGLYQLIALPLKIKDGDAAPVRAVLLPLSENLSQF